MGGSAGLSVLQGPGKGRWGFHGVSYKQAETGQTEQRIAELDNAENAFGTAENYTSIDPKQHFS